MGIDGIGKGWVGPVQDSTKRPHFRQITFYHALLQAFCLIKELTWVKHPKRKVVVFPKFIYII